MYRDKTRRKRQPGRGGAAGLTPDGTALTDVDVQRSAVGVI